MEHVVSCTPLVIGFGENDLLKEHVHLMATYMKPNTGSDFTNIDNFAIIWNGFCACKNFQEMAGLALVDFTQAWDKG